MLIKAIIFDAYGTLISTGTGSVDATAEILTKCGRGDIPADVFYADWKKYHRKHIDSLAEFVNEAEYSAAICSLRQKTYCSRATR